ncbi:hypothetical protein ACVZDO_24400 [Pseudomonas aeruginosa]|uniref:hypothetical protein n=1 Tax=Pseudomonas aeruginosa TaxID=287 RepID=UPI00210339FF|nr:hypothetical protein [Pseudomonas aeruginosa]UTX29083.1 hypothetical protein NNL25_12135 [Pseudomonas aeruginosa]HCF6765336.1 hypothetical protein [Pseudomonas aeruginosa]HCL3646897.1 hypothetical protein [Pseudomonas aeruginosa]HCT2654604.1 hypothetical protein [Pseudomonas aeruginosa]
MTALKKPAPMDFKTQYGLALDEADDAIIVDLFAGGAARRWRPDEPHQVTHHGK